MNWFNPSRWELVLGNEVDKYQKLELAIKELTGHSLWTLRDLFAKGYTLEPPRPSPPLAEMSGLATNIESDRQCCECVHYRFIENYYNDESYVNVEYCDGDIYRPCSAYREACEHFCLDE